MLTDTLHHVKESCDTPLSGVAYFPVSTKTDHNPPVKPAELFPAWLALKRANRVKRGNAEEKQYRIDVHRDMLKISRPRPLTGLPEYKNPGGGKRGKVKGFSRESRKRMIELLACTRNDGFKMFVTLTYDDNAYMKRYGKFKADFEALRKRFERAFPQFSAIWRIETQVRKSGILKGTSVPHYHMIVFCNCEIKEDWYDKLTKMFQAWGSAAWQQITSSTDANHIIYGFHVTALRNRKQAMHYVSKYVGKTDTDVLEIGRRWGRIGQINAKPSEKIDMDVEEIIIFRRLIRRWIKNKNRGFARKFGRSSVLNGFSVFGLGDTIDDTTIAQMFDGYNQFVLETRRQRAEQECYQVGWNS